MMRYLKLIRCFLANALQLELEYRLEMLAGMFNALLSMAASIAVLAVLFSQGDRIGDWTFSEFLILLGVFKIFLGLSEALLVPNLGSISNHVRKGTLDFVLLKPISSQFYVSVRHIDIWKLTEAIIGAALILFTTITWHVEISLLSLMTFVLMMISGMTILYALWLIGMVLSFWLINTGNMITLLRSLFQFARFPVSVFPSWLRVILTFLFPLAIITTFPASLFTGRGNAATIFLSIGIAFLFLLSSSALWRYAIKYYTSASS